MHPKAELTEVGILFHTQFPFLEIFIKKRWISKKLRPSISTTFKTDILKVS
jgi:hypothetical protein